MKNTFILWFFVYNDETYHIHNSISKEVSECQSAYIAKDGCVCLATTTKSNVMQQSIIQEVEGHTLCSPAHYLCVSVLIYEPANPEALTFHPIIIEKLQLGESATRSVCECR